MSSRLKTGRTITNRIIIVCTIFLSLLCSLDATEENRPAVLSSEELRQRLAKLHSDIHVWYVEYESVPDNDPAQPQGAHVHRIVAARAPDQFYHWSAKGTAAYTWRDDPLQQRLTINSSSAVSEKPIDRTFIITSMKPDDPLPGTIPQEFLFVTFGWWPFEERPAPRYKGDTPSVLRDIARSPNYAVNPVQQLVDGHWCHVLEYPKHDRLWLDCERNCALLAREILNPKTGSILQRIEMKEHREVKPDIWVPMEFRNILFEESGQKRDRRKLLDVVIKVLNVKVNEPLSDTLFSFEPRPGSIQYFGDGRFEQKVPGGTEYLDEIVGWIQQYGQFSRFSTGGFAASVEAAIEYIVSIICIVAILVLHWRKRTRNYRLAAPTSGHEASRP